MVGLPFPSLACLLLSPHMWHYCGLLRREAGSRLFSCVHFEPFRFGCDFLCAALIFEIHSEVGVCCLGHVYCFCLNLDAARHEFASVLILFLMLMRLIYLELGITKYLLLNVVPALLQKESWKQQAGLV